MTLSRSHMKAVVIGSGIGGLSMAIFLARMGYTVTVVEKNALPGGVMQTYRRRGIDCPVGVHYLGALDRGQVLHSLFELLGIADKLSLERMGSQGFFDRYLFPDFTFDLPTGIDAFEDRLRKAFPEEQEQINAYMQMLRQAARLLASLDFLFSDQGAFEMLEQLKPLGPLLSQWNCSVNLKSVLALPSSWIGVPLDRSPCIYHNMTLCSYLASAWRLAPEGPGLPKALVASLEDCGGKLLSGERAVRILLDSGSAQGVELASGGVLDAPLVIGAIHPSCVLDLLPEGAVRPVYRKRIRGLANTHGIVSVHYSVDADRYGEIPHNLFLIEPGPDGVIEETHFIQLRRTARTDRNMLSVLTSGNTARWKPWGNTHTGHRGEEYEATKKRHALRILAEAEEATGKFHGAELLDVMTPLTFRDWNNSPEGSAYGVLHSSDQLPALSLLNRPLVPGLYFAGQSVLAPGILGTLLGSLTTMKTILGPETFCNHFRI